MHQQSNIYLYISRIFFAGALIIVLLTLASALISALSSDAVLSADYSLTDAGMSEDSNIITAGAGAMLSGTHSAATSVGKNIQASAQTISNFAANTAKSTLRGGMAVVRGTVGGVAAVGRGIGGAALFVFRIPGKVVGAITVSPNNAMSAITRPSEGVEVPLITNQTSAEMVARVDAQQQQKLNKFLSAQLVANRSLGGSAVAGNPDHGGYPAKWDNAPQDSLLDKWGMYNRECVSYAAWKVHQTFGFMPYWGGVGNANQWVSNAKATGIPTGSTPKKHSVAISMNGYYGHAMWVEEVKGKLIYISQYNYDLRGRYSEMWVDGSSFTYLYFK